MAKKYTNAAGQISLARTGGVLPDGVYQLVIDSGEQKQGSKSAYIALKLTVVGRTIKVFENLMLSDNVRWKLEQFLDAVNAPTTGNMSMAQLLRFIKGKKIWCKLTNDTYESRTKNVVAGFLTAEEAAKLLEANPQPEQAANPGATEDEDFDDGEDTDEEDEDGWGDDDDDDDDDDGDEEAANDGTPF